MKETIMTSIGLLTPMASLLVEMHSSIKLLVGVLVSFVPFYYMDANCAWFISLYVLPYSPRWIQVCNPGRRRLHIWSGEKWPLFVMRLFVKHFFDEASISLFYHAGVEWNLFACVKD
jgi:hypothetical protein